MRHAVEACNRAGGIEAASGGTRYLDEIGDKPMDVQVRHLRTLQDRCVTRVGETRSRPVSFRLISATHSDLGAAVAEGSFRQDIYYRIREVEIELPPLAAREKDVVLLARYFLDRYSRQYDRHVLSFSPSAYEAIVRHGWPGNVRELEGRIKRAVVLAEGALIEPEHLELEPGEAGGMVPLEEAVRQFKDRYVAQVLAMCSGVQKKAAEVLGVDPRTIHRYLKQKGNA
jgi:DNA-binding NtrC family response regulator